MRDSRANFIVAEEIQGTRSIWKLASPIPEYISDEVDASRMITHLLYLRGLTLPEEIQDFLDDVSIKHDPFLLPDAYPALGRIEAAIQNGERVAIYGDFDCLDYEELIWTNKGLIKVGQIQTGDKILGGSGNVLVLGVRHKQSEDLISIESGAFRNDPLLVTHDHPHLVLKYKDAKQTGYIKKTKRNGVITRKETFKSDVNISMSKVPASEIETDDFLLYPVFKDDIRINPVTEDVAWLYGVWLAEGYITNKGRTLMFCLNRLEEHTHGAKVIEVLQNDFKVDVAWRYDGNSFKISCHDRNLVNHFFDLFNSGSDKKEIPSSFLFWTKKLQQSLLEGYFDGDGCYASGLVSTISRKLAYGIFALAIQAERYISCTHVNAINGLRNNREKWQIRYKKRANVNGFYIAIDGDQYFASKVLKTTSLIDKRKVVDIETTDHTIITKFCITHNCDGLASSAILRNTLVHLGIDPLVHIPHRTEGHGIRLQKLEQMSQLGINLIISVDCGITANEEVEYAKQLGMDIIITDHHDPGLELPSCLVVAPSRNDSQYPFRGLCGAGVAYKLASALDPSYALSLVDLAALGTIADVVPLTDENRTITKQGLRLMQKDTRVGLKALFQASDIDTRRLSSSTVAFYIGPKINSANRMADPRIAYDLIISDDPTEANRLSKQLTELNRDRQDLLELHLGEVKKKLGNPDTFAKKVISGKQAPLVVIDGHWPAGISGLIASKVVDIYGLPAIVASTDGDKVSASARSTSNVHIGNLLDQVHAELPFDKHGGHAGAAGFVVAKDQYKKAQQKLRKIATTSIPLDQAVSTLYVDAEVNFGQISLSSVDAIEQLAPFGQGFPEPVFLLRNVTLTDRKVMGDTGRHFSAKVVQNDYEPKRAVFFFHDRELEEHEDNFVYDIVFSMECNSFRGVPNLEMKVKDWRLKTSEEIT